MTGVLLVIAGVVAGAVLTASVYRAGRTDGSAERARWEAEETGLTDVSPASVPDLSRWAVRPRHAVRAGARRVFRPSGRPGGIA